MKLGVVLVGLIAVAALVLALTRDGPGDEVRALGRRIEALEQAQAEASDRRAATAERPADPADVQKWLSRLDSENEDDCFAATIELARLGSLEAVPFLMRYLDTDKDFYVRLGAATALGELRAADGVTMLIDHLADPDELVRTACAEAFRTITGHDIRYTSSMATKDRIAVQDNARSWWRDNERAVRDRLRKERESPYG